MWDQLTIGYLAALIDGEGHIKTGKTQVSVSVTSTDLDIVERAHQMSGIGTIQGPYQYDPKRKPSWRWSIDNRKDIARLLLAITPLLSARKTEHVMAAAEYLFDHICRKKPCAVCGEMYQPSSHRGAWAKSKYCGQSCNDKAYRARRKTWKSRGC